VKQCVTILNGQWNICVQKHAQCVQLLEVQMGNTAEKYIWVVVVVWCGGGSVSLLGTHNSFIYTVQS
jgi:hypothetical protein